MCLPKLLLPIVLNKQSQQSSQNYPHVFQITIPKNRLGPSSSNNCPCAKIILIFFSNNNSCQYIVVFLTFITFLRVKRPSSFPPLFALRKPPPHRFRHEVTPLTAVAWPMGPSGWRHFDDRTCSWANYSDPFPAAWSPLTWWFGKSCNRRYAFHPGVSADWKRESSQNDLNSGLGTIVICPDVARCWHFKAPYSFSHNPWVQ